MSSPVPWQDARAILTAAALGVPIAWENEPFTLPEPPATWLLVECTGDVLDPIELGAGVWQEEGTLFVHVMVPSGSGSLPSRALAKQIANLFRGLGPRTVVYRGASIGGSTGASDDGAWWRMTVSVHWLYQDIQTA